MPNIPNIELNDGLSIPLLGFGLWKVDDGDAEKVILTALKAGYRSLDEARGIDRAK